MDAIIEAIDAATLAADRSAEPADLDAALELALAAEPATRWDRLRLEARYRMLDHLLDSRGE